jgi:multimeric flavodoxin WrbA
MAMAAWQGAQSESDVHSVLIQAQDATAQQMLAASAYIFACPENLGTMSGEMKEMFDRLYYPLLGRLEGRAFASLISAGSDGSGAQRQMDKIITGWRLRRVAEPHILCVNAQKPADICAEKDISKADLQPSHAIGAGMAVGLALGIY